MGNTVRTYKKQIVKQAPLVTSRKPAVSFVKILWIRMLKKGKRTCKVCARNLLLSPLFHQVFKISCLVFVVGVTLYGSYLVIGKTFANEVVVSQSEIVARVAKLTPLPQEEPDQIVRVQDAETLRKQNSFYENVEEGDYILMYKDIAVIYNLRSNSIVASKRVEQFKK